MGYATFIIGYNNDEEFNKIFADIREHNDMSEGCIDEKIEYISSMKVLKPYKTYRGITTDNCILFAGRYTTTINFFDERGHNTHLLFNLNKKRFDIKKQYQHDENGVNMGLCHYEVESKSKPYINPDWEKINGKWVNTKHPDWKIKDEKYDGEGVMMWKKRGEELVQVRHHLGYEITKEEAEEIDRQEKKDKREKEAEDEVESESNNKFNKK